MVKETFKEHKKTIIITCIVIVLPMLIGLILWDKLPDMIATHFGTDNEPNGWSSKAFTVFAIPGILLALQLFMLVFTSIDPKKKNISGKALDMVLWIIPVCSMLVGIVSYAYALGIAIRVGTVVNAFVGVLYIIIGNYLPKNGANFSMGIRSSWALDDPENWNRTNRFAGYCFIVGGIIILLVCWLESVWITLGVTLVIALLPYLYSFLLYKKKEGLSHHDD